MNGMESSILKVMMMIDFNQAELVSFSILVKYIHISPCIALSLEKGNPDYTQSMPLLKLELEWRN